MRTTLIPAVLINAFTRNRSKIALLLLLISLGWIVSAKSVKPAQYAMARDLPRGPVLYAQFSDLPALLDQWQHSKLKEDYLESTNYQQLLDRHLAIKIAARWQEFNQALGLELNSQTLAELTDKGAAIAVYDIGRIDVVFIAPIDEEKIAAAQLFNLKDKFEEVELKDGTSYYWADVDADRGRQKQKILFALQRGRFVLATNEALMLRTLSNINNQASSSNRANKTGGDRLSEDANFKSLSAGMPPHFLTIWVDQQRLNRDYYFRTYWAMKNLDQLRDLQAGIFDVELQADRWIERRDFITERRDFITNNSAGARNHVISAQLSPQEARRIAQLIPTAVPFYQLQTIGSDNDELARVVQDSLFDRVAPTAKPREHRWGEATYNYYDNNEDYSSYDDAEGNRYGSLDSSYDRRINDDHDAKLIKNRAPDYQDLLAGSERKFTVALATALNSAAPFSVVAAQQPRALAGPLFAEFNRAAVISLAAPSNLNHSALEAAIADLARGQLMIAGSSGLLDWSSSNKKGQPLRELDLPMLGWQLCYGVKGQELVISNSEDLLRLILTNQSNQSNQSKANKVADKVANKVVNDFTQPINALTVIRFDQRETAFDQIFERLDQQSINNYRRTHHVDNKDGNQDSNQSSNEDRSAVSQEFFSGNIVSLLDVLKSVTAVEIKRSVEGNRQHEEITIFLDVKLK